MINAGTSIWNFNFNNKEAIEFSKIGCIEEWIHIFLKTAGNNLALSEGLKLQKRFWLGPVLISVDKLIRCCGPEEDMEYYNEPKGWEIHINKFCDLINNGWEYPPLIAEHDSGKLIIRDGNHRHEALRRMGIEKCWVIIWDSNNQESLKILS